MLTEPTPLLPEQAGREVLSKSHGVKETACVTLMNVIPQALE